MIDFALEAERQGCETREAIARRRCTFAVPPDHDDHLRRSVGRACRWRSRREGSELRRPLGVTIVGGLIVSQVLTLYTTPVVF